MQLAGFGLEAIMEFLEKNTRQNKNTDLLLMRKNEQYKMHILCRTLKWANLNLNSKKKKGIEIVCMHF